VTDQLSKVNNTLPGNEPFCGTYFAHNLRRLGIFPTSMRYDRGDLIVMCQLFTKQLDIKWAELFQTLPRQDLGGHPKNVFHQQGNIRRRQMAFGMCVAENWKNLPLEAVNAPSVVSFKRLCPSFPPIPLVTTCDCFYPSPYSSSLEAYDHMQTDCL